jgi:hypothetical protein
MGADLHHTPEPIDVTKLKDELRRELIAELLAMFPTLRGGAAPAADTMSESIWDAQWVPLKEAARRFGGHRDTWERWCRRDGIGCKVGGRWQVDLARHRAFQEHRPYPRLQNK